MRIPSRILHSGAVLLATSSIVLPPLANAQTAGIVTDGLEANHDTDPDAGTDGAWQNVGGNSAGVDRAVGFNAVYNDAPNTLHQNIDGSYDLEGGIGNANRSFRLAPANPDSYGEILGNPITQQDASFEIWFKPPTFDTAANNSDGNMRHRILWETGGGTGTGLVIHGSTLFFASRSSGNQAIASVDLSTLGIGPDEFVQAVGVVRTQGNDGVDLYVNGQLAETTAANLSDWDGGDGDALGGRGGGNLGGYGNGFGATLDPDGAGGPTPPPGGQGWRSFGGEIGIFRFYSNALDATQIAQNFEAVAGSRAFSTTGGAFNLGATWEGGSVPATSGTTAFVGGGNNVNVPGGSTFEVETLAIGHQSGTNPGLGTVTVNGTSTPAPSPSAPAVPPAPTITSTSTTMAPSMSPAT